MFALPQPSAGRFSRLRHSAGVLAYRPHTVCSITTTVRSHMGVTPAKSSGDTTIRPFTIETPEADLDDLSARIAATQWPEKETVSDDSQGVPLATMQKLAGYW